MMMLGPLWLGEIRRGLGSLRSEWSKIVKGGSLLRFLARVPGDMRVIPCSPDIRRAVDFTAVRAMQRRNWAFERRVSTVHLHAPAGLNGLGQARMLDSSCRSLDVA